jgi:hypothetical protein
MALTTVGSSGIKDGAISIADVADYALTSVKMANTGVTAGTYGGTSQPAVVIVDGAGRITSARNSSGISAKQLFYRSI